MPFLEPVSFEGSMFFVGFLASYLIVYKTYSAASRRIYSISIFITHCIKINLNIVRSNAITYLRIVDISSVEVGGKEISAMGINLWYRVSTLTTRLRTTIDAYLVTNAHCGNNWRRLLSHFNSNTKSSTSIWGCCW